MNSNKIAFPLKVALFHILFFAACKSPKQIAIRPEEIQRGRADITVSLQKAVNQAVSGSILMLPAGDLFVTETIRIAKPVKIKGAGSTKTHIFFRASEGPLFFLSGIDNVQLSDLSAKGRGRYSAIWKGSQNIRYERAVLAYNASSLKVSHCRFENFGKSAITLFGCRDCQIKSNIIEGTHRHGVKLKKGDNYQFGIAAIASEKNGLDDVSIENNDIGFVTQGIITSQGKRNVLAKKIKINRNYIHDIIGQHGIYCSTSNTDMFENTINGVGLEGIKIQAAHGSLRDINLQNNNISNCPNSQGINITEIHEGKNQIQNVTLSNNKLTNCARGVNLYGKLLNVDIKNLTINNIEKEYAIYIRGFGMQNINISDVNISSPKNEAIYINNDEKSKNIVFSNISILSDLPLKRSPIRVNRGSDMKFEKIKVKQQNNSLIAPISIGERCKRISYEKKGENRK